jgi:hypothetical protein
VTNRTSAPAAAPAPAATPAPSANSQSAVAPVVDLNSKPANQPAAASHQSKRIDPALLIGGGALALLVLGIAAFVISRRRRRADEWQGDWADEPEAIEEEAMLAAPVIHEEEPAMVAPSAFTWGPRPEATGQAGDPDDDRLPGESWVERAYRGPSANNPSVSLKNRLRRAAFFDKRERDVAAGTAEPVDPDAGLPDAMIDADEHELA